MPLRIALVAALALLVVAAPAGAATVRTANSPASIRAYNDSGRYARDIAAGYASATRYLRAELARRPAVRRPAVVLDIDETTLSNYGCMNAVDFALSGLAVCAVEGRSRRIPAAAAFVRYAQRRDVRVFFITGAPQALCAGRVRNLRAQGISGTFSTTCNPGIADVVAYKSGARRSIARRGHTIVANIGDQRSDLQGGFARRTFKLPNPIYLTT